MNRREFLKAGVCLLPLVPALSGCAGPTRYDAAKYGTIRQVGLVEHSSSDIGFWADIDRSSNMYSAAGANSAMARRFKNILGEQVGEFCPRMYGAMTESLRNRNVESVRIPVPRTAEGRASENYSGIHEPLLFETKMFLGFVLVKGGVMPSATIFCKLIGADRAIRFQRHISIGYGKRFLIDTEVVAFPEKLYKNGFYITEHPAEVANDLLGFAEPLGRAAVAVLMQDS